MTSGNEPFREPSREPSRDEAVRAARVHFDACRARIDGFVGERFGPSGTLRLHRAALGPDLLRAPVNVLLAPAHVLVSLAALAADGLRLRRLAAWLRDRHVLLETDTGRVVEERVATGVLGLALAGGPSTGRDGASPDASPDTLADAMLSPPLLEALARRLDPDERAALEHRMARAVRDYAGTRGAVAEATVAIATLVTGALIFRTFTPGLVSMAPSVAGALTRDAAVSRFAFGETLGAVWYGAFPPSVSGWLVAATLACLVPLGAVFAAFAGILADPLQVRLGIHRRRLLRLVDALETEATGTASGGFATHEHYYARLFDIVDAGASVLRIFRG